MVSSDQHSKRDIEGPGHVPQLTQGHPITGACPGLDHSATRASASKEMQPHLLDELNANARDIRSSEFIRQTLRALFELRTRELTVFSGCWPLAPLALQHRGPDSVH